jgi:penicillin G amidase
MKIFRIVLKIFAAFVILAAAGLIIVVTVINKRAVPTYKGELMTSGLNSDVTVFRDERGMPHIYASDEHDLYFAVGYVMAQERLWQMDLIRRATTGRLSEIFGASMVQTDLFLRSLSMEAKSKKMIGAEDPEVLSCLKFYSEGVNSFIKDAGSKLPPEFIILGYKPEPWKPEDVANIIGYMGWDLAASNLVTDIFNFKLFSRLGVEKGSSLIPDNKAVKSFAFPGFSLSDTALKSAMNFISSLDKLKPLGVISFSASNNWVVAGSKSETGKPIFSNDMHLGLSSPGIWIQMHQVIPGKLNVTGVAVPGEPFIVAGHNEKIAWGMTNLMVDDIDLFTEKINPDNQDQYFFNNNWQTMIVRDEKIKIHGGKSQTLKLRFTQRGPIISDMRKTGNASLSMRWSGYDMSDEIKGVYLLNRATGWNEFRTAISYFRSISQNFAYADVNGNIGLNTGGGIPVRKGNGSIIRSGETDEFDWKGYVPFDQLPTIFDPESGSVSSANNKTAGDDYPYYIAFRFFPPYRIERIRQMLGEKQKLGITDFKRMVTDQHSAYAALMTPRILKLSDGTPRKNPLENQALKLLSDWDYNMSADLAAPSIFEYFRKSFSKNLLADELGDLFGELPSAINDYYIYKILNTGADEWVDNINTPQKEGLEDIISMSFTDCINQLSTEKGINPDNWKWGDFHKISLDHPLSKVKILDLLFGLNSRTYRIGGSNHTVCPYSWDKQYKVNDGASERHIFNTADWDDSYTVIPTGISGVPASEFYLSQTPYYIQGKFYRDHFSEEAVKSSAKYKLIMKPVK